MNLLNVINELNYQLNFQEKIYKAYELFLKNEEIEKNAEVSLIIIDNKQIHQLNNEYRQKDKPTDVLSFPADKEINELTGENILGDIYISYEKIQEQAKEYMHSEEREWLYLFVHGLHHLIGYDHINEEDERKLDEKVETILKELEVHK